MKKFILLFVSLSLFVVSCSDDDSSSTTAGDDAFDRKEMLTHWADHIIVPAYTNFVASSTTLDASTQTFIETPNEANLVQLREDYQKAYLDFQTISIFEIGPAETIGFRGFVNTYPTNATAITQLIENYETPNLELPSSRAAQGFPALDYFLYGVADNDNSIIETYSTGNFANGYKTYLGLVSKRIKDLSTLILNDWNNEYRDNFVANTSSSSTGSVDMLANDFIIHFEKFIRSGKVGIPAGVFSGNVEPQTIESYYQPSFSKSLLEKSLNSSKNFFKGLSFDQSTTGLSFESYLDYLNSIKEGEDLSTLILNQYEDSASKIGLLNDNLLQEVENNNSKMLTAYDSMQANVILLKIDMLQALSISVDYVDTDGD
ncbi:imelysin [Mesonia algae]|uniref:Imelysin n=1 Tax=Mesonia algae TaxID=213248 RepID=A0A2W7I0B9_9FLAO|nr:imelysin family protein [Mesonia algae]PZW39768.1 imelysin [Mesonia algae]